MSHPSRTRELTKEEQEELQSIIIALTPPKEPETFEEHALRKKRERMLLADSQTEAALYRLNSYKKKACISCKEVYFWSRENFEKSSRNPQGVGNRCILCAREARAKYYSRPDIQDRISKRRKERSKDPAFRRRSAEYRKSYLATPTNRIVFNLRTRLRMILSYKRKSFKNGSVKDFIGCSRRCLIRHIESLWPNGEGMSWDNYGKKHKLAWHIDHIVPYAYFKEEFRSNEPERIKRASQIVNHYTNLCPLWGKENLRKSDTLPKWVTFYGRRMNSDLHLKVYGESYSLEDD